MRQAEPIVSEAEEAGKTVAPKVFTRLVEIFGALSGGGADGSTKISGE